MKGKKIGKKGGKSTLVQDIPLPVDTLYASLRQFLSQVADEVFD